MPEILLADFLRELVGVGEVAVMRQCHPKGGVDEERLRFEFAAAAGGRVPHMADAHPTLQSCERTRVEDVAHHAVALLQMELVIVGDNPGSVLAAVLQHDQTVIEVLDDVAVAGDGDDSTHRISEKRKEKREK